MSAEPINYPLLAEQLTMRDKAEWQLVVEAATPEHRGEIERLFGFVFGARIYPIQEEDISRSEQFQSPVQTATRLHTRKEQETEGEGTDV